MGDLTRHLVATLGSGGVGAREALQDVGELLRKVWQPGFVPYTQALEAEEITSEEALGLRDALAAYCVRELDASARRSALSILAKEGRPELRESLVRELHDLLKAHRVACREMFQLLLALEDVGEAVFPPELLSRSLAAVEANLNSASDYLQRQGILVPWA